MQNVRILEEVVEMKRTAVLVMVALLAFAAGGFALKSSPDFAVGAELTNTNIETLGAMVNLHFAKVPLFMAAGLNFIEPLSGGPEVTATVDYWLLHKPIGGGHFSWYLGLGGYGVFGFDPSWVAVGVRMPIALQIWPMNSERLEVFLELAPAWVPWYDGEVDPTRFQAQAALGFRLWTELGK